MAVLRKQPKLVELWHDGHAPEQGVEQLEGNQRQLTLSSCSRGSGGEGVDAGVAPEHRPAGTVVE